MTRPFIHKDFLLANRRAEELYHSFAESLPIIDYHNHLSPKDIAQDRRFENLTQAWLAGDHYKWRAMRAAGVEERFVTGNAPDREKFLKWAETVPGTLRNPLYHWTHLELARIFGIDDRLLGPATAPGIWDECNAKLARPEFSVREILRRMKVEVLCTTDDPADSLEFHQAMRADRSLGFSVFPAFRPDRALAVEDPAEFGRYVARLAEAAGREIRSWTEFVEALQTRHAYFHEQGCRVSDHGLEAMVAAEPSESVLAALFAKLQAGARLEPGEAAEFKSGSLYELAVMDWERGWVQQFHLGALRNVNTRMRRIAGPDAGFDTIGEFEQIPALARFLDRLDREGKLARTIVYNLNPKDGEAVAALLGSFQDGTEPGKMQYGAAWWFLDQMDGMRKQIEVVSNMGLLGRFVGMLTDSRNVLSFPRHEYFRRLLCSILGEDLERGLVPDDMEMVGDLVKDIGYFNAKRYFRFDEAETYLEENIP